MTEEEDFTFGTQAQGILDDEKVMQEEVDKVRSFLNNFKNQCYEEDEGEIVGNNGKVINGKRNKVGKRVKNLKLNKISEKKKVMKNRKFGSINKETLRLLKCGDENDENINLFKHNLYDMEEWGEVHKKIVYSISDNNKKIYNDYNIGILTREESQKCKESCDGLKNKENDEEANFDELMISRASTYPEGFTNEDIEKLYDDNLNEEYHINDLVKDTEESINNVINSGVFTLSQVLGEDKNEGEEFEEDKEEIIDIVSDSTDDEDIEIFEHSVLLNLANKEKDKEKIEVIEIPNSTDEEAEGLNESSLIIIRGENGNGNGDENEIICVPDSEFEEDEIEEDGKFFTAPEIPNFKRVEYFKGWKLNKLREQLDNWGIKGVKKFKKNEVIEKIENICLSLSNEKWEWCIQQSTEKDQILDFKKWDNYYSGNVSNDNSKEVDILGKVREILSKDKELIYSIQTMQPVRLNQIEVGDGIDKKILSEALDSLGVCWTEL